jgi:hypothetical protein
MGHFTHITSLIANRQRWEQNDEQKLQYLRNVVAMKSQKIIKLNQQIRDLECEIDRLNRILDFPIDTNPKSFIDFHLQNVLHNKQLSPCNQQYDGKYRDMYILFYFLGTYAYSLLHLFIDFPSLSTIKRYKALYNSSHDISIHLLDGSQESLHVLLELFFKDLTDTRCVIAVDAASVKPILSVRFDGKVDGLVEDMMLTQTQTESILNDENMFADLAQFYSSKLICYEYVYYLCPLSHDNRPFPIALYSANRGIQNNKSKTYLEIIAHDLQEMSVDVLGFAFDADPIYESYAIEFVNRILLNFEIFIYQTLPQFLADAQNCIFFDPLHLLKRDRYRIIKDFPSTLSFTVSIPISVSNLQQLDIPLYLLDNSAARKMEDALPLKLFSFKTLRKAFEKEDSNLIIALLPSVSLKECIFNSKLSLEARIEFLNLGFAIVFVYYLNIKWFRENQKRKEEAVIHVVESQRSNSTAEYEFVWTASWCAEYLITVACIIFTLITQANLNLGSLGTHFLEHFFGKIRKKSQDNHSHKQFLKTIIDSISEAAICKEYNIQISNTGRASDSGCHIGDEPVPAIEDEIVYLRLGVEIFETLFALPVSPEVNLIKQTSSPIQLESIIELYESIPWTSDGQVTFRSTAKDKMTATGGISNYKRWITMKQLHTSPHPGE